MEAFWNMIRYSATMIVSLLLLAPGEQASARGKAALVKDGKGLVAVVVAENTPVRVRDAATELAVHLGRISGAEFEIHAGDGKVGIAVGLAADFPVLNLGQALGVTGIADGEAYILRSHTDGLYVIGATEAAVEHAVWDLLYRLGCRQFFPGPTWEVVPRNKNIEIRVDTTERPDYLNRRIWYGLDLGLQRRTLCNVVSKKSDRLRFRTQRIARL